MMRWLLAGTFGLVLGAGLIGHPQQASAACHAVSGSYVNVMARKSIGHAAPTGTSNTKWRSAGTARAASRIIAAERAAIMAA